jgi:hypothetical protein
MPAKKGGAKKKKDVNAPKKAQNAYMLFSSAKREEYKKKNPDAKAKDIMGGLAGWWKDATADEKKPFEKKAEEDKKRYEKEKAAYTPAEPSGDESGSDDGDAKPKRKRTAKKQKDPNAPKRPKTAYFCYMDSVRAKVRKANPDLKITEISKKIGEKWGLLSADEKAEFDSEAKELKNKYDKELAAYNKKKAAEASDEESGSDSASEEAPKKKTKKAPAKAKAKEASSSDKEEESSDEEE